MLLARAFLVVLATACTDDLVSLNGRITNGPLPENPGLVDGEIEILDYDSGQSLATAAVGADGEFEIELPGARSIVALVRSPNTVTTAFVGTAGFVDVTLDEGTLYGLDPMVIEQWRSDFAGCPDVDSRIFAFGIMEFVNLSGKEDGFSPIAGGGRAQVLKDGETFLPCYLDPDKGTYDPKADRTGATGRFAIFGLEPGPALLDVVFEWAPDSFDAPGIINIWVPEGDEEVVVPYLPLRLQFPI
ncbi:MAG: hypothetical protein AAGA48_38200 [Myxococcota bacterium]